MGHQIGKFTDNAQRPIIAFDFDGTITTENRFPEFGQLRKYTREVIDLLHELGVVIVIWTSRDTAEYINPLAMWLDANKVYYDRINTSIEFAPFEYEARKVYAHMYVDDRGYGWINHEYVMLDVLVQFMIRVMGVQHRLAMDVWDMIYSGKGIDIEQLKNDIHGR